MWRILVQEYPGFRNLIKIRISKSSCSYCDKMNKIYDQFNKKLYQISDTFAKFDKVLEIWTFYWFLNMNLQMFLTSILLVSVSMTNWPRIQPQQRSYKVLTWVGKEQGKARRKVGGLRRHAAQTPKIGTGTIREPPCLLRPTWERIKETSIKVRRLVRWVPDKFPFLRKRSKLAITNY